VIRTISAPSRKKPYANEYTTAECRVVELPDIIFRMFFVLQYVGTVGYFGGV
jgi:hypothetical protein